MTFRAVVSSRRPREMRPFARRPTPPKRTPVRSTAYFAQRCLKLLAAPVSASHRDCTAPRAQLLAGLKTRAHRAPPPFTASARATAAGASLRHRLTSIDPAVLRAIALSTWRRRPAAKQANIYVSTEP